MHQPTGPATEPRFVDAPALRLLGMRQDFPKETAGAIPALWGRFAQKSDSIEHREGENEYGVCSASDDGKGLSYAAAVAVTTFESASDEFVRIELPATHDAVFAHARHVAEIRGTFAYIMNEWLPASGRRMGEGPDLEVYGESFNPKTGLGGVEIWIPLQASSI